MWLLTAQAIYIYIAGDSYGQFPTTADAYNETGDGDINRRDIIVVKLNDDGTQIIYATYVGGSNDDSANDIHVDGSGNVYVAGLSESSNFPTTGGAYNTSPDGGWDDGVIFKLNSDGSSLNYSTYVVAPYDNEIYAMHVDDEGYAYFAGYTSGGLPVTSGAFDEVFGGISYDGCFGKLSTDGSSMEFLSYLGGSGNDTWVRDIKVDDSGNIFMIGQTRALDFPTTSGAYMENVPATALSIHKNVFVTKMNSSGNGLVYSTYVGGNSYDDGKVIDIDSGGNAYFGAETYSTNFPTTVGAYDRTGGSSSYLDLIFAKLNSAGSNLVYSTYIDTNRDDRVFDITVDSSGKAYFTGTTRALDFPATSDAFNSTGDGSTSYDDAYLLKLNSDGSDLDFSTLFSTPNHDRGYSSHVANNGLVTFVGSSAGAGYPTTPGVINGSHNGNYDMVITQFHIDAPISSNFLISSGTTDFFSVPDMNSVSGMTLANSNGNITWDNPVNAYQQDYDSYVTIGDGFVSMNVSALSETINTSAHVCIRDISACEVYTVYYAEGHHSSLAALKGNGSVCNAGTTPACANIVCDAAASTLCFDVAHFDGYGGEGGESVPEFSDLGWLLIMVIVVGGFLVIRKKDLNKN